MGKENPNFENEVIYQDRLNKLKKLQDLGFDVYPAVFERTHTSKEILDNPKLGLKVTAAGRLMSARKMGKLCFAHIQDESGRVQIALNARNLDPKLFSAFNQLIDIGDIIGAQGEVFQTKTGEVTINLNDFRLLSKCLRPLPEKFHGIKDPEILQRQRYLDLIMNPETRRRFEIRTRLVKNLRTYLDKSGFTEVETPILQTEPSGASATPFRTHHNALDMDLYLRIAPETYLKRLLVGGFERVYEIGRDFRNEGIDSSHLQDFTMLEFYSAYWDAHKNLKFTEDMIKTASREATSSNLLEIQGRSFPLNKEWPVRKYVEVVKHYSGIDLEDVSSLEGLRSKIKSKGIILEEINSLNLGQIIDKLYKVTTRPKLIEPQFLIEYPVQLSPLARGINGKVGYVDQFQLVMDGMEVVKGYSELVDPFEQRKRLLEQASLRSAGDEEAMSLDEDYIKAMEYGMPPNSGVGVGIDRLAVILSGADNIKDMVFFPLIKPRT